MCYDVGICITYDLLYSICYSTYSVRNNTVIYLICCYIIYYVSIYRTQIRDIIYYIYIVNIVYHI